MLGFRSDKASLLGMNPGALAARAAELPEDEAEDRAWSLWALGAGLPGTMRYTEPVVKL